MRVVNIHNAANAYIGTAQWQGSHVSTVGHYNDLLVADGQAPTASWCTAPKAV